jgi:membrane protein implicated in regulation of membrane protease activity
MFCLAVASGLLIWGQTVLEPILKGVMFLAYWFACFVFTVAAIVIALLDIRAVRRRIREEQQKLIERTLSGEDSRSDGDGTKA